MVTTKRTYECNLCHGVINEDVKGVGIEWTTGNTLRPILVEAAESHLCNGCLTGIRNLHTYEEVPASGV